MPSPISVQPGPSPHRVCISSGHVVVKTLLPVLLNGAVDETGPGEIFLLNGSKPDSICCQRAHPYDPI